MREVEWTSNGARRRAEDILSLACEASGNRKSCGSQSRIEKVSSLWARSAVLPINLHVLLEEVCRLKLQFWNGTEVWGALLIGSLLLILLYLFQLVERCRIVDQIRFLCLIKHSLCPIESGFLRGDLVWKEWKRACSKARHHHNLTLMKFPTLPRSQRISKAQMVLDGLDRLWLTPQNEPLKVRASCELRCGLTLRLFQSSFPLLIVVSSRKLLEIAMFHLLMRKEN